MSEIVFVINPGSTSTKLAIYDGNRETDSTVLSLAPCDSTTRVWDEYGDRLRSTQEWFEQCQQIPSAVAAIGGLLRPVEGGTYRVNSRMVADARNNLQGEHASNLGCVMADEISRRHKCPAYVVDPVSVDEFDVLARYSGHPAIVRKSLSHALNIHAAVRMAAQKKGVPLHGSSFVVAHLGGGISVAPVRNGRIIDVNDASSDGPFSPERTGGLPLQQFISLCFSGQYKQEDVRSLVMGRGGLFAYHGTKSAIEVERKINAGQEGVKEVYEAMAYQIAKEIGAMATVLEGKLDGIILTGTLASSMMLTEWISLRTQFLAPVTLFPGEHEMMALAEGTLRVLRGEEHEKEY